MEYILPKKYLSYSSISLWNKDKDAFRRKYYEGEKSVETAEMIFGKKIARLLENPAELEKHPVLNRVPRYKESEHKIDIEIEGIPVIGYLDSFCPDTFSILEFKSGHASSSGKDPWDKVKVMKHDQLPFYSLLVEEKYNKVNSECQLVWIETEFKKQQTEFDGHILERETRDLLLTGKIEIFKRKIAKWERERMRELIIKTAQEIHEDFKNYK